MSRETVERERWTCDRCGLTVEVVDGETPDGWDEAKVGRLSATRDLCPMCAMGLRGYMEREPAPDLRGMIDRIKARFAPDLAAELIDWFNEQP